MSRGEDAIPANHVNLARDASRLHPRRPSINPALRFDMRNRKMYVVCQIAIDSQFQGARPRMKTTCNCRQTIATMAWVSLVIACVWSGPTALFLTVGSAAEGETKKEAE